MRPKPIACRPTSAIRSASRRVANHGYWRITRRLVDSALPVLSERFPGCVPSAIPRQAARRKYPPAAKSRELSVVLAREHECGSRTIGTVHHLDGNVRKLQSRIERAQLEGILRRDLAKEDVREDCPREVKITGPDFWKICDGNDRAGEEGVLDQIVLRQVRSRKIGDRKIDRSSYDAPDAFSRPDGTILHSDSIFLRKLRTQAPIAGAANDEPAPTICASPAASAVTGETKLARTVTLANHVHPDDRGAWFACDMAVRGQDFTARPYLGPQRRPC